MIASGVSNLDHFYGRCDSLASCSSVSRGQALLSKIGPDAPPILNLSIVAVRGGRPHYWPGNYWCQLESILYGDEDGCDRRDRVRLTQVKTL